MGLLLLLLLTVPAAAAAAADAGRARQAFLANGLLALVFASFLSYRGLRKGSLSRRGAMAVRACLFASYRVRPLCGQAISSVRPSNRCYP